MASSLNAALCALVAVAFWTCLGHAIGRRLLPRALALGAAPVLGWAVHSAVALPILTLVGFSPLAIGAVAGIAAVAAGMSLMVRRAAADGPDAPTIPYCSFAAAMGLAVAPTLAILPKFSAGAVRLADPIFDHAKIAIVDAMARQGLPPVNPVFAQLGTPSRLVYYYLWHFSAAELALPLRVSGWEADIGLTWFTAFASLSLMMGVAVWLAGRQAAAIWVVALAAAASLRMVLGWIFGPYALTPFLQPPTGFAGWLFQAAWVPQHLMAASCSVTAILLIARYAQQRSAGLLVTLALVVVAGFESSTYVGGVTFAIAALTAVPVLLLTLEPSRRRPVAIGLALAAVLAASFAAPFIRDQFSTVAARGDVSPIVIRHFAVLGEMFPDNLRRVLDLAAYWLILLPIEFPAIYVAGVIALAVLLRSTPSSPQKSAAALLACLAGAGLGASWLLVSTLGDNNDLGLRAVLPAAMVLIAAAAAGATLVPRRAIIVATALGGLLLSVPDTVKMIRSNAVGSAQPDGGIFAQSPALWTAVRRYASPNERVANNPLYLQDLTPWPVNMSWALLANRSSCFAGREMALAFAPLPPTRREAISTQFIRIFAGQGTPDDIDQMAKTYGCDVVVLVPQDGAWDADPFASSLDYRLAENRDGKWRVYVRR